MAPDESEVQIAIDFTLRNFNEVILRYERDDESILSHEVFHIKGGHKTHLELHIISFNQCPF